MIINKTNAKDNKNSEEAKNVNFKNAWGLAKDVVYAEALRQSMRLNHDKKVGGFNEKNLKKYVEQKKTQLFDLLNNLDIKEYFEIKNSLNNLWNETIKNGEDSYFVYTSDVILGDYNVAIFDAFSDVLYAVGVKNKYVQFDENLGFDYSGFRLDFCKQPQEDEFEKEIGK